MAVVVHIIKYLTGEGRSSCLHSIHLKLLSHPRHGMRMNGPNVLYNLLMIMVIETQKGRSNFVSHHCLIKLLVERSLRDVSQLSWEEFMSLHEFRAENYQGQERIAEVNTRVYRKRRKTTLGASSFKDSSVVDSLAVKEISSNVESVPIGTCGDLLMNIPRKTRASARKGKDKPIESTEVEICEKRKP